MHSCPCLLNVGTGRSAHEWQKLKKININGKSLRFSENKICRFDFKI